jgi:hypothetical protein
MKGAEIFGSRVVINDESLSMRIDLVLLRVFVRGSSKCLFWVLGNLVSEILP